MHCRTTVAFTVSCQRPKYLKSALSSWKLARGVENVDFLFCLEPAPARFDTEGFQRWVTEEISPRNIVLENARRLGCQKNTKKALNQAFLYGAETVILAEEDVTVATDTLEYFDWAFAKYYGQLDVATVCAHTWKSEHQDPASAVKADWFNPLVWGTWRDRWENFISPTWGVDAGNPEGWDLNLRLRMIEQHKFGIFPVRSRSLHLGEQSTLTNLPLAEFLYKRSLSSCFQPEYEPQDYCEVSFDNRVAV